MTEPVRIGQADLHVTHHQFVLSDPGFSGVPMQAHNAALGNGLVGALPGVALVLTGIHTGFVSVSTAAHDVAPPPELDGWDDVVETSVQTATGTMLASGIMTTSPQVPPSPTQSGPGTYRLRVHARGRDVAIDLVTEKPVEYYHLEMWPAPPAPDALLKLTSKYGALVRAGTPLATEQPARTSADGAADSIAAFLEAERRGGQ